MHARHWLHTGSIVRLPFQRAAALTGAWPLQDPRITKLPCSHKGTYADDCICQRVTQHRCYIVATCDRDLRRRLRKVRPTFSLFVFSVYILPFAVLYQWPLGTAIRWDRRDLEVCALRLCEGIGGQGTQPACSKRI